jgi:CheY-like chemotaxis protein
MLLVDSHRDTLSMLRILFSQYRTTSVTSASEAVSEARSHHFDLYLVENRLPDESGVDLCSSLRLVDPDGKVVFFTSDDSQIDILRAFEAGAVEYVTKPNVDELIEAVHTALADVNDLTH